MATATGNAVLRAYNRAAKKFEKDPAIVSTHESAGFIIPDGQKRGKRKGFQVFVRVVRFDESMLKRKPESGGLLASL